MRLQNSARRVSVAAVAAHMPRLRRGRRGARRRSASAARCATRARAAIASSTAASSLVAPPSGVERRACDAASGSRAPTRDLVLVPVGLRGRPRSGRASGRSPPRSASGPSPARARATARCVGVGDRVDVVAVDRARRACRRLAARARRSPPATCTARRRELAVLVVLADEDDGSFQSAAMLSASWNAPWFGRALAEEADRRRRRALASWPRAPRRRRSGARRRRCRWCPAARSRGRRRASTRRGRASSRSCVPAARPSAASGVAPLARQWP